MRAFWVYYKTVNLFNLIASILLAFISGLIWFPILFCTVGLAMGFFAYSFYFKDQYYFYHNLGYTKRKLAVMMLVINAAIAIPILILLAFLL